MGAQAAGYYLGMLAYFWVLATPAVGFFFGVPLPFKSWSIQSAFSLPGPMDLSPDAYCLASKLLYFHRYGLDLVPKELMRAGTKIARVCTDTCNLQVIVSQSSHCSFVWGTYCGSQTHLLARRSVLVHLCKLVPRSLRRGILVAPHSAFQGLHQDPHQQAGGIYHHASLQ